MLTSSSIDSDLAEQGNDAGIMTRKSSIGKIANIVGPLAKLINHRRITSSTPVNVGKSKDNAMTRGCLTF